MTRRAEADHRPVYDAGDLAEQMLAVEMATAPAGRWSPAHHPAVPAAPPARGRPGHHQGGRS